MDDVKTRSKGILILVRHGQSMWNPDPQRPEKPWKYAGAMDVPLSEKGVMEALELGKTTEHFHLDVVYTSMLIRAQTTALLALACHSRQQTPLLVRNFDRKSPEHWEYRDRGYYGAHNFSETIPVFCSRELNERNFGRLQGIHQAQQQRQYTKEQLARFRCEFDSAAPGGETAREVSNRTIEFFDTHVGPSLREGKNVLMCCHGFVIRCIIAYLHGFNSEEWTVHMKNEKVPGAHSELKVHNATPLLFRAAVTEDYNDDESSGNQNDRSFWRLRNCDATTGSGESVRREGALNVGGAAASNNGRAIVVRVGTTLFEEERVYPSRETLMSPPGRSKL